jgi:glutamyl-Q tRNA(Asp) synthetase
VSCFTTRFAPSPTGYLHLGHAYAALTAAAAAADAGGRFLLRIEDIDLTRSRPVFEAAILEDLAWLGLSWEQPVRRQSQHLADHQGALAKLRDRGLLYRCFRTRREVLDEIARAPHGPGEGADGAAFRGEALSADQEAELLAQGRAFAWRLSLSGAAEALGGFERLAFVEEGAGPGGESGLIKADPAREGDVILARKDVGVAYHLAVVVDDADQGVTHVVRGDDLFAAAHIQVLLQALLGLPTPTYRHHRLLLGPNGKRLAKRNGAQSLRDLRAEGVTPADICDRVRLAGGA